MKPVAWTSEETAQLRALANDGLGAEDIALELDKTIGAVREKLHKLGWRSQYHSKAVAERILAPLYAERDARKEARWRRDFTAEFCNDPPPGYSALDQRNGRR